MEHSKLSEVVKSSVNPMGGLNLNKTQTDALIRGLEAVDQLMVGVDALAKSVPVFHNPELTKAALQVDEAMNGQR